MYSFLSQHTHILKSRNVSKHVSISTFVCNKSRIVIFIMEHNIYLCDHANTHIKYTGCLGFKMRKDVYNLKIILL